MKKLIYGAVVLKYLTRLISKVTQNVILCLVSLSWLLFTGCYDAVFQSIRDEIILENGTVNGMMTSLVRYSDDVGDWLYAQNGCLYKKLIGYGDGDLSTNQKYGAWSKVSTPNGALNYEYFSQEFKGRYVCRVAADADYVYILTCQPRYDEESSRNIVDNFRLYALINNKWVAVDKINRLIKTYISSLDEDNYMMDASIQLMCTNAPKREHRKAYIRIGGDVPYETDTSKYQLYSDAGLVDSTHCAMFALNGEGATPVPSGAGTIDDIKNLFRRNMYDTLGGGKISCIGASMFTCCCCYYDGETKFFSYYAATTDETKTSDPTYIYFGDGKNLRYYDGRKSDLSNTITVLKDVTAGSEPSGVRIYQSESLTFGEALFEVLDQKGNPFYTNMTEGVKSLSSLSDYEKSKSVIVVVSQTPAADTATTTYVTKEMTAKAAIADGYSDYIVKPTAIKDNFMSSGGRTGDSILSICYSKDKMYLGTDEDGAYKATITNGVPSKITDDNDNTKFSSQMSDPYVVPMLLCVDPSLSSGDSKNSFYSSMFFYYTENNASASYRDVGLWAYYPGSDGWNKE